MSNRETSSASSARRPHPSSAGVALLVGAATLASMTACTDAPVTAPAVTPAAETELQANRIESNRSPMLDLVNDASSRLTGQLPGNAPLVVALRAVRSATQRGSTEHLTAALDDADLAISLSRDIDALPSADRDAVALHLMILRQLAAAEPGR